jgi:selenide,water dikinase
MVDYGAGISDDLRTILYDPQTAGGLLISTPHAENLLKVLNERGVPAVRIGDVTSAEKPRIYVAA